MTRAAVLFVILTSAIWTSASSLKAHRPRTNKPSPFALERDKTLRKAQVWFAPETPIEGAKLDRNPGGGDSFSADQTVACRFKPGGIGGSTPKFECELESGEKVKVKYGADNPEVYAEVAATRLLAALGFPADLMYVVGRVRCFGCPADPFKELKCLWKEGASTETCFPHLDYATHRDFEHAVIERALIGRRIETKKEKGWGWAELSKIDPGAGGASRAQVDALRMLAVFLGHWDNKAKNQRLLCRDDSNTPKSKEEASAETAECQSPLAMVQDLGATFGPDKVDLEKWAATPIWADAATCTVTMAALPYGGSSFDDARISEEGRAFLARLLGKLSTTQIRELFDGARMQHYPHRNPKQRNVDGWVRAFQEKVRAIVDRPPCPAL
jgi:hypothetical protein